MKGRIVFIQALGDYDADRYGAERYDADRASCDRKLVRHHMHCSAERNEISKAKELRYKEGG